MKLTGSKYDFSLEEKGDKTAKELNTQFRVLADHIRASLMLIADGVVPSNTGRGYVLRRLIRRCSVAVRKLGYDGNYMENLLTVSYNAMIHAYPEMEKSWKKILEIAVNEETAFNKTLSSGLDILNNSKKNISGENAFKLHDTLGFPIELTLDIADSQGLTVDKTKFEELMKEQKSRAREDTMKKRGRGVDNTVYNDLIPSVASLANKLDAVNNGEIKGFGQSSITEFTGYESLKTESKIIGIIADGISVPAVNEDSAEVEIVLDITSFYAQSGGQLADHGKIVTANGGLIEINDVQKATPFLTVHKGKVISGEFAIGDKVDAVVNYTRRNAIAKAHTSTHIIHQALHEIVGESATQAGSENSPNRVRFDFHSANAVTDAQLKEIEKISNEQILENYKIHENYMSIDAAKNAGAMALFGEKYGDEVRVISFGNDDMYEDTDVSKDWSIELCGGTHIETVGSIGSIALVSEGSIGSGLRRVEALVADSANEFHQTEHALVSQISSLVGAKPADLPERVTSLIAKLKEAETAVAVAAKNALNSSKGSILNAPSLALDNVNVFVTVIDSSVDSSATREFALALLNDASIKYDKNAVVALIVPTVNESNLRFSVTICATDDLVKNANFNAGGVIKEISTVLGGGGGGKPNFATGGSAPISAVSIAEIDSAKSNVQKTVLDTLKSKLAMG
jgi:alanyl-tRNA synthetase